MSRAESYRKSSKKYYEANKEIILEKLYWKKVEKKYGITAAQYQELLSKQGSCCAICKTDFSTLRRKPDIDHCHETGVVRGLLCPDCNMAIGAFRDDPDLIRRAIEYVEVHK